MANLSESSPKFVYPTIICDNGSCTVKAGFAGEDFPRAIIPTVVGISWKEMNTPGINEYQHVYTGQTAIDNRNIVNTVIHPINDGEITDWDAMEHIWHQMYYEDLLVPPEEYNILHTESVSNNASSREKLVETMFETFNVPNMSIVPKSVLSLYSNGQISGLVVHSGYEDTQVVPVFEGYPLESAVRKLPIGGYHISLYLMKLMNDRGYTYKSLYDMENLRHIKEKFCYFSIDYENELATFSKDKTKSYTLPDGMVVKIKTEAFQAPEILFNPGLFDIESELGGLHNVIHDACKACDRPEQKNKLNTILLAGGNTLMPFLPNRLKQMLTALNPDMNINVIEKPERKYASWIGGSILASLPNYQTMWITRKEYEEKGASVVHTR